MSTEGPTPATKRAEEQAERSRDAMEKIRSRTDLTAKGLAAAGSAAVAGVGYAKLADVFPVEGTCWVWFVVLGLGFVSMIVAVIVAVRVFNNATRSVMTEPDANETIRLNQLDRYTRFSPDDEEKLKGIYKRMGQLNGVESLAAYQARARRFERIAARMEDGAVATVLRKRANAIMSEIVAAQERAGMLILRNRANRALFGRKTLASIFFFAAGLYAMALSADAFEGDRKERTEIEKARLEVAKERIGVAQGRVDVVKGLLEVPKGLAEANKVQAEVAKACADALAAGEVQKVRLPSVCTGRE